MKGPITLINCLLVLALGSCRQREELRYYATGQVERRAVIDAQGYFMGDVTHYYQNGRIKRVVPFFNHAINGCVKSYYPTGRLDAVETWVNGEPSGKIRAYYADGTLKYDASLRDTLRVDTARWFYPNGKLHYWARYDATGRKVDFSAYNPNGEVNPKLMYPLLLSDADTLLEGQDYWFEIVLGNRRTNAVRIQFPRLSGAMDSAAGTYSPYRYRLKRPAAGSHHLKAKVFHHWLHGDTVWTNWYNIAHPFYVRPKPLTYTNK